MDNATVLLIIGALLPVAIRFAKQKRFSPVINGGIAVIVYAIVGVVSPFLQGQPFTLDNVIIDIGLVMVGGTTAYTAFWKNTEVEFAPPLPPDPAPVRLPPAP